jgi:hypothetical protein
MNVNLKEFKIIRHENTIEFRIRSEEMNEYHFNIYITKGAEWELFKDSECAY